MSEILEEYKKDNISNEENEVVGHVEELTERNTKEFSDGVNRISGSYKALDMDAFIKRIGGMEKIEEMKKINATADGIQTMDGRVVHKDVVSSKKTNEDLEEWKRGFMDGFEEAYKRLMNK